MPYTTNANATIREQTHGCQLHRCCADDLDRALRHCGKCSMWSAGKTILTKHLVFRNYFQVTSFPFSYDGVTDLSTAECYNPMTNAWTYITPMGTKRSCLGICAFDGLLYVCGGYDGASCLSSMERYDSLTGVWSSCPTMSTRRRYCRLAVLDNCIYSLGGFDSTNYQASGTSSIPTTQTKHEFHYQITFYSREIRSTRRSLDGGAKYD